VPLVWGGAADDVLQAIQRLTEAAGAICSAGEGAYRAGAFIRLPDGGEPVGPLIEALPSVASAPNQRWATDLCGLWGGRDGWLTLALVMISRDYTRLVRGYGLRREFITPHCPQQNGMVERLIRTLKEQFAHMHRFETLQHASRVIGEWISFYNPPRPHQTLAMKTPAEAYALAA
jgi:putative transposase